MNYSTLTEPLLLISLCLFIGIMLGVIYMLYQTSDEIKSLQEEVEKHKRTSERWISQWKDKYTDDGTHEY